MMQVELCFNVKRKFKGCWKSGILGLGWVGPIAFRQGILGRQW